MKKLCLLVLLLISHVLVQAQVEGVPQTEFTRMYLPVWQEAVEHCLEVAKAMPEENYAFRPTEISKTFGEQMVHIAASTKLLTQRYVEGLEVTPNTPDANKMNKDGIIALMEQNFGYFENVILTIDQAKLDETCKMYHSGNIVSRSFALFYVQDHMANHRAKANLYIRMNGIEPPEYTW